MSTLTKTIKVPKRLARIPLNKREKYEQRHLINLSIPKPLVYALRVEAARRGLTMRSAVIVAIEGMIRDGIRWRDFLANEEAAFPKTAHWSHPRVIQREQYVELQKGGRT